MKILLATNNLHKKKEIKTLLRPLNICCVTPLDIDIKLEVNELGQTFSENALLKARTFFEASKGISPVLSDDSGLCVDVLGGKPGIHSARYGQNQEQKIRLTSAERNKILLKELEKFHKPKAYFITHLCLYFSPYRYISIEESLEGYIAPPKTEDSQGFGYDPIFYVHEGYKSLGECSLEEKNTISSRGKALAKLIYFLRQANNL